ncbi:MAG: LemA family protein [Planctomycetota bacterium]
MKHPHPRRGAVSKVLAVFLAFLLALLLAGGCAVTKYNDIVTKREDVDARWSAVESDYKHRSELVPQLVNTVRGAKDFESETLEKVMEARAKATSIQISADALSDPDAIQSYLEAQSGLGTALGRLFAVAESYPALKSVDGFRDLQVQLEGIANRINVSRKDYIQSVRDFNSSVRRFPGNVVAGFGGYEVLPQFEATEAEAEVPEVDFGGGE